MPKTSSHPFKLGVIILAAGGSSRMGSPKQLIRIGATSLVAHASHAALATGARPVAVIIGADAKRIQTELAGMPILVAENPDWMTGLASSIRVGIATLLTSDPALDAIAVAPCDQPALSAEVITRLSNLHRSTGLIAASRYHGRNGAPAVFGREHFATLSALSGDEGARKLLNTHQQAVTSVEFPELGVDLDTPADLAAWQTSSR